MKSIDRALTFMLIIVMLHLVLTFIVKPTKERVLAQAEYYKNKLMNIEEIIERRDDYGESFIYTEDGRYPDTCTNK